MRSYYRSTTETWHGNEADVWFEFEGAGETPVRQVTRVGERWLSSLDDHDPDVGPLLTDQPLQPGEFGDEDKASPEEFEHVWAKAVAARGKS